MTPAAMRAFFAEHPAVARVLLHRVQGSAPREAGAEMFVAPEALLGTIGGGEMEFRAVAAARALLRDGLADAQLELPLGPDIGQCCGGRVNLLLSLLDDPARDVLVKRREALEAVRPMVLVFGAGHVGRAIEKALEPMPLRVAIIDSREAELALCHAASADLQLTAMPEIQVRQAGPRSAFVIATHDHGLDFLITAEALARGDAAYIGLIGSATKRAAFRSWLAAQHPELNDKALTCPIGAAGLGDKRPEVIAAHTVSELTRALSAQP